MADTRGFISVVLALWLVTTLPAVAAGRGNPGDRPVAPRSDGIHPETPAPLRYVVQGARIMDALTGDTQFFKGMGYSPYLPGETPIYGDPPGNDERYDEHLNRMNDMGVDYIHVFPMKMPPRFFEALDKTDMRYGQDIWIWAYAEDFLDEAFLAETMDNIRSVIDHVYEKGRPDRLVLFSIGDELQAASVIRTNTRHPNVRDYQGRHLSVFNRTPTETALARLIDGAMDYELTRYGRRHLYTHTSWTHIGPIGDRPDLEVPEEHMVSPDFGDLICLNIYTYANGVRTSPPGSVTGTPYQGYLEALTDRIDKPLFITQVGLSTSPFEPKPWVPGFGGHRVEDVPRAFAAVWKDVQTARGSEKICGTAFFELHDEWWKSGEDPTDSTRHDPEDPEEWFGLFEVGPDRRLIPKGRIPESVKDLYRSPSTP